jgi:phage terminase large subunit-like protein
MAREIKIELDLPHPGQQTILDERERFNVLSCGRRWGKTDLTYLLCGEICEYNLNNGFNYDMGYMSPTYKNLAPTWRRFCNTFKSLITRKNEQQYSVEIMDSFQIEFWSLDKPENIRGRKYKRIIIDEAALVVGFKAIFNLILLPTIGDLVGDAYMFSTPRGFNDFHHFYRNGQNPLLLDWASWIMPTASNPFFPPEELAAQKSLLSPDEFAQEWEGKFVALGNSPFDIDKFEKIKNIEEALREDEIVLHKIRYWDIADSVDGDFTASARLNITNTPRFIISSPVRYKGLWGNNYKYIKMQLLAEPDVLHVFETEGVGGIAWQMIQMDPDLAHINKMPATRVFTQVGKQERAQLWALELQNGRMLVVEDFNTTDFLDEVASFPHGDNDDWVDSVSGGMLAFIYFYGGYKKLMDSKKIKPKEIRATGSYETSRLVSQLKDYM